MDYTEQFIRLNCSLMSDYKMMKLNAEMKCMGIGLYIQMILFLRRQQEYKHDFNELDLLAEQWGATVEDLQHLIKDFNLFVITEDGYFRCLYLDEVMGYQNKLSEQRAAAGSKGGRSSKKKTVQTAEKVITSTVLTAADKEANDDAGNKENNTESNAENSVKCMKNTIEKSDDENVTKNTLQCIDNECVNGGLQASFKQNFIREEKNREEKKNNSNKEKEITAVVELFKNIGFAPRQKCYINRFSLSGFGWIHHARFRIWKKEELDRPWINAYRIFVECYLPPQVRAVNHGRYGSFTCKMLYLTAVRL